MSSWTVNLDNATFDFAELAWDESSVNRHPEGAKGGKGGQFAPKNGSGGGSKNKNGSSSKPSGKSSGPARFTDSNGDGKDDRQLTPAQLKQALAGLPADERRALQIYPSVLGAIKLAIQNGESPQKHLNRLPPELRYAAERAGRVAATRGSGPNAGSQSPKDATKLSRAEVDRLTSQGWAGNPGDSAERLYPPDHPKNPKNMSERAWSVDLDEAVFDFAEVAWKPDEVIELANGKKSKVSALIRKLRADPRVDDPERLAGWIRHNRGGSGRKSSSSSSNGSNGSSGGSPSNGASSGGSSSKPDKPSGRMVGGFYIDDDDEDEFLSDPYIEEEPKTKEEIEQEKYEAKVLRELEREVPDKIYKTIMEFGGLKTRDDLREEYSEIPNTYKRKDGTNGDEMAEMLAMYYPQYGIETERDLIDFLAA